MAHFIAWGNRSRESQAPGRMVEVAALTGVGGHRRGLGAAADATVQAVARVVDCRRKDQKFRLVMGAGHMIVPPDKKDGRHAIGATTPFLEVTKSYLNRPTVHRVTFSARCSPKLRLDWTREGEGRQHATRTKGRAGVDLASFGRRDDQGSARRAG